MFAPKGYQMFKPVYEAIWRRVEVGTPSYSRPRFIDPVRDERYKLARRVTQEYFETCPSLSVAPPEGEARGVAPEIGFYANETQVEPTYQGYLFLNTDTWTVEAAGADARARAARSLFNRQIRDPAFGAAWRATDRTSVQQMLANELYQLQQVGLQFSEATVFCKFQGWALVIKPEDMVSSRTPFECLDEFEQREEDALKFLSEEAATEAEFRQPGVSKIGRSEAKALKFLLEADSRGEVGSRSDANDLLSGKLSKRAIIRVCHEAKKQRPHLFPLGRPKKQQ